MGALLRKKAASRRKRDIKKERGTEAVLLCLTSSLFVPFCEQLLLIYVDFLGRQELDVARKWQT